MPYKDFYRMQAEAFGSLPVLNLFYSSRTHQDGWRYLIGGIAAREPFLLVAGDYGMGKTLLSMMLSRLLAKKRPGFFVQITDPHCGFAGILRQMAERLSISTQGLDEQALLGAVYAHLGTLGPRQIFSIIIDDAQELGQAALVRLRAFANFNRDGYFPVQLILFAHPSFLELLLDPQLRALDQRIKRRHQLKPLTLQETKEYIYFRLFKSGAPGTPSFTDDAFREIFAAAAGIPRLINNICDVSLARGASRLETCISRETIRKAVAAENQSSPGGPGPAMPPRTDRPPDLLRAPPVKIVPPDQPEPIPVPPKARATRRRSPALPLVAAALAMACVAAVLLLRTFIPGMIAGYFSGEYISPVPPAPLSPRIAHRQLPGPEPTSEPAGDASAACIQPQAVPAAAAPAEDYVSADAGFPKKRPGVVSEPAEARPYTLKLACFNTPETAYNAAAIYARKNLSPAVARVNLLQDGLWWVFYTGSFASRAEAARARDALDLPEAHVIPMPFACRIGVFDSDAVQAETYARLEQLGCRPYVLTGSNGTAALFTGAFKQRANAEALRRALADSGIESTVTLLSADPPPRAQSVAGPGGPAP